MAKVLIRFVPREADTKSGKNCGLTQSQQS